MAIVGQFAKLMRRQRLVPIESTLMPIQHFPPPPGIKARPLSYAARVDDLLYISGVPDFAASTTRAAYPTISKRSSAMSPKASSASSTRRVRRLPI